MFEIIGLAVGIIGLIIGFVPIVADSGKYISMLKVKLSRTDLIVLDAIVTFRVDSATKIHVFGTAKYLVRKHKPTLIFPITNHCGPVNESEFFIDNVKIENAVSVQEKDTFFKHQIYDKAPGETLVLEFSSLLTADIANIDLDDDGLSYSVDVYPCRHLKIQVIYPENVVPRAINFSVRSPDIVKASFIEERFGSSRLPFRVDINRKAVEWLIEYPKFNRAYRIGWSWR